MAIDTNDLREVIAASVSTLLASECVLQEHSTWREQRFGWIGISGEWNGTVALSCDESAMLTIAAAMLGEDAANVSIEDAEDAFRELVNVIGGNVKSIAPGPSSLSLPQVADNADSTTSTGSEYWTGDAAVCGVVFRIRILQN